ncbi:MAG: LuxR C-terminal-related transcriptional regulator, partial [Acidimicrobiia bacterium]
VVWSTADGVIRMANQQAAALANMSLDEMIGRTVYDFAQIPQAAMAETEALATGSGGFFGTRALRDGSHREVAAYMWTRAIRVGEEVAAVALVLPASQTVRLGRDPSRQLRRLYPMAIGVVGQDWHVAAVSVDIEELTGRHPELLTTHSLLEIVHPGDVAKLTDDQGGPPPSPSSQCSIRIAHQQRGWVETCWLLAPFDAGRWAVAIVGEQATVESPEERIAELEISLRRIGAEVKAAGIVDNLTFVQTPIDVGKLHDLTTRQWEVLILLLQGKRVPTIAAELYVSQSTVRNHLSTIFRKFDVHSQPELLEVLRT